VLRGNHHDGWVFGASDPISGHIAMMAEAKAIGELAKTGWKPKRTLVYLSWDAEEPMLLGSTEWAETHADELEPEGADLHQHRRKWTRLPRRGKGQRFPAELRQRGRSTSPTLQTG